MTRELDWVIEQSNALTEQVGGSHYLEMAIQPVEFIAKNHIPFIEGNIIKYLCRWRRKNGLEDLQKARHYLNLLIDLESHNADIITKNLIRHQ